MRQTGLLIVIEGIGGSGKNTQRDWLAKRLVDQGCKVKTLDFPRYHVRPYGPKIAQYLAGELGEIDPDTVSLWYARDRLGAKGQLERWLKNGYIVLLSRYYSSNLAYQAARLPVKKQVSFVNAQRHLELNDHKIPEANLVILIDTPISIATGLIKNRGAQTFNPKEQTDIHERTIQQVGETRRIYLALAKKFSWPVVSSIDPNNHRLRPPDAIAQDVWQIVSRLLSEPQLNGQSPTVIE